MFRRHSHPTPPTGLQIRTARDGARHVVALEGELDLDSAPQLERELRRVEATGAAEIVIDLGGLQFIDSIGLSLLLHASRRTQLHRQRLMLVRGSDSIQQRFELTGIAARLQFVDSDAVA